MAGARLQLTGEGQVVLQPRHEWADGTTHLGFTPTAFLERLAVLVPRPRVNLVLYRGLLAPRAAWRAVVVPGSAPGATTTTPVDDPASAMTRRLSARGASWADDRRRRRIASRRASAPNVVLIRASPGRGPAGGAIV